MAANWIAQARQGYAVEMTMVAYQKIRIVAFGLLWGFSIILLNSQSSAQQRPAEDSRIMSFFLAAQSNDTGGILQGLDQGVPVDSRDANGRTALLIAAGADVNAKDNLEDSPFLYAGAEGRLEVLKMTVAAGADLASVKRYGGTALIPAAHHGHVEVVRYLLTTEVDVDHVNYLGWTALLEAVILGDGGRTYQRIVALLLNGGADPTISDKQGIIALEHAKAGKMDEIVRLLELAVDRNE